MFQFLLSSDWTKRMSKTGSTRTATVTTKEKKKEQEQIQAAVTEHPQRPTMATTTTCHHQEQEIPRSVSWESWSSSLTSLNEDLHDDKRTWSFKDDYVSFPSLIDHDDDNNTLLMEKEQDHHHHLS